MPGGIVGFDSVFVRQRDVGNRDNARTAFDFNGVTEPVTERVELLHVVEVEAGLRLDPAPQAALQAGMAGRLERAVRQGERRMAGRGCLALVDDQQARRLVRDRDDDGNQIDNGFRNVLFHLIFFVIGCFWPGCGLTHYMLCVSITEYAHLEHK